MATMNLPAGSLALSQPKATAARASTTIQDYELLKTVPGRFFEKSSLLTSRLTGKQEKLFQQLWQILLRNLPDNRIPTEAVPTEHFSVR